jgi:hypothetical protein
MHGKTIGQCDWSGILFKLPGVSLKVGKTRNFYCNWESAFAHAASLDFKSTNAYITKQVGVLPNKAPHFEHVKWFGGHMDESSYIEACEIETGELDAVLSVDGVEESVTLDSVNGEFFAFPEWQSMEPPVHSTPDWQIVALTKRHAPKEFSEIAAKIFAKESLLEPWRARPRYLNLTMAEWKQLTKQKEQYKRRDLQDQLNTYDARVSKDAVLPTTLMKGMKLPGKSGKALAEYAKLHLGQELQCRRSPAAPDAQIPGPV